MWASSSSGCSVLGKVGDSDGEQERMASALLELHVPHCLGHDQRQKGPQAADFAEASSSHALKAWSRWQGEIRAYGIQALHAS